jgi:hypothetical protein
VRCNGSMEVLNLFYLKLVYLVLLPVSGSLYSALSMEVLNLSYLILVYLVLLPTSGSLYTVQ